jgi:ketopantoate reductase
MIDFVDDKLMEIEAIFGELLSRVQSLGIATPQLALLTALLCALNARR